MITITIIIQIIPPLLLLPSCAPLIARSFLRRCLVFHTPCSLSTFPIFATAVSVFPLPLPSSPLLSPLLPSSPLLSPPLPSSPFLSPPSLPFTFSPLLYPALPSSALPQRQRPGAVGASLVCSKLEAVP